MGLGEGFRLRFQDWVMSGMDDLRPDTISHAAGRVLEVGFGTGRNLCHYTEAVHSLAALDPLSTGGIRERIESRIAAVPFPVEQHELRADGELPFDDGQFDAVVTTWTLCSIPHPDEALKEMRRVLRPGGRYLFIEHGRSESAKTAAVQDRLNPMWRRFAGGCNINRRIGELVSERGFGPVRLERFMGKGPGFIASMYRGSAERLG